MREIQSVRCANVVGHVLVFAIQFVAALILAAISLAAIVLFMAATPPQCSAQADLDHEREAQLIAAGVITEKSK